MKANWQKILLLIFAGLACGPAWSQTAANWNFNNTLTGTAGTDLTASVASLSVKTTGSFNAGSEYYGEGGWPGGTIDTSVYLQFQTTASVGYSLSLNSVTITLRRSTTGTAAGSGPTQWSLRSSLDNYATDIFTGSLTTSYVTTVVSLPAAFQAIPSTVSFHLYGYNMVVTAGGNNRFVWDNISAQGKAIPIILAERNISLHAKAGQQNGSVELQWETTGFPAGTNLSLERSTDGDHFSAIDRQETGVIDADYQFEDISLPASSRIYYRVIANEPDGEAYRSAISSVQENAGSGMQILGFIGQGAGGSMQALLNIPEEGQYQLVLLTIDGKMLSRRMVAAGVGKLAIDFDLGNYPHGVYVLTLLRGGQAMSRQFIY
jgi:hypothetical protein